MAKKRKIKNGHNSIDSEELKKFNSKLDNLESEAQGLREDIAEVKAEMKLKGYDMKAFNAARKRMKLQPAELKEFDDMVELYSECIDPLS